MKRTALIALALVALTSCGDDDGAAPSASSAPPASATLPTIPESGGYPYATGAEDVVVEVSYEGGFAPIEALFARTPVALVTGDGRVLSTGPVAEIFPGPLLPNVLQRPVTPQGIEDVLTLADELGLLADVEYARNDLIADAPDTVVTITVDGTTYRHQAYALGIEDETDPDRAALAEFVAAMSDLPGLVGDDVGEEEPYVAPEYLIRATPVDPATLSVDVEPTILPWPADASVRLADAAECAVLPAAEGDALFVDATALTFFTDGGETYAVAAVPRVPGRTC